MICMTSGAAMRLGALFLGTALGMAQAAAQPTAAQQEAIKSSCRSDYMANCMSVQPGGIEALQCLERNMSKLSGACKAAVTAVEKPAATPPAAASAPAPAQSAPAAAPASHTPTAAPASHTPAAAAAPAPAKPAAKGTAKPAAAPGQPTPAQTAAIRSACPNDFRAKCPGVSPGGEAALACLQKNEATLSASCKKAVSAIGGAAPAPAAATATATPAAAAASDAAAPVAAPVPVFPPLMEARILRRFCSMDFATLCKGVVIGEGRALQCLAQNSAALSPGCKQAMATATR